jgi:type I restriction enzyme S subunit
VTAGRAATDQIVPGRCAISVGNPGTPLPPGWRWTLLTDVARLESGHTPSRHHPEYWDGPIPWIGIRDAREHHTGLIADTEQHVTQAGIDNSAARVLPAGTVCLSRTASVGYVVITTAEMATSQDFVNWVCSDQIDPRFLQMALLAEGRDGLAAFGEGSVHTTIYFPAVKAFHIALPPVDEQRRIVDRLDALLADVREARAELDAVPRLVERLRRSVLAAAFRGDLTATWREAHPDVEPASALLDRIRAERRRRWAAANPKKPYVEPAPIDPDAEGLPDLPPGWCWARLGEILAEDLANGRSVLTAETGGFPVLRLTAIRNGTILVAEAKQGQWSAAEAAPFLIRRGDLLVSRGNGSLHLVGRGGLVREEPPPVAYPDTMIRIRPTKSVNADFLAQLWGSPVIRHQIESRARTSAGIYKISQDILEAIAVPLPPAAEQTAVAARVGAALEEVAAMDAIGQSTSAQLDLVERELLAKAFRGELVSSDDVAATPGAPQRARSALSMAAST